MSSLPDGTEIIWRLLTIGEWLEYDALIKNNTYPFAFIENEIFSKCVQDKSIKVNELPAGIVSSVVHGILLYSGPQTIDELTHHLDIQRIVSNEILHMLVTYVCQAFPAYKPEDVYILDYPTLMLRVAQAENKLLRTGAVTEPLMFVKPEEQQQVQPMPPPRQQANSKELFNKYYSQNNMTPPKTSKQTIISAQDIQEHTMAYTGHEKEDQIILQYQMEKETAPIYQDYLQQSKDGKIVIKTPEERKAEYLAKVEQSKKHYQELAKKQKEQQKQALEQAQQTKKAKRDPGKRRK